MTPSGIYQVVHDRARAAGLPAMHPHQLRHAFATSWLAEGGNENELMLVAGWKSRIMIDRYTKARPWSGPERAMPACHQATGYSPRSSAIKRSCPGSNMTQNLGRWRVSGSIVTAGVPGLKWNENAFLSAKCREPLC
jgi:hypothetical protein